MRARPVLVLAVLPALVLGGAAVAAPAKAKPVCNLVTDAEGDGTGFVMTDMDYLPNDPNLDLVSGDVATKGRTVTAVIRTAELALSDPAAPTGRAYYANFTVGATTLYLSAALDGSGAATYSAGYLDTTRQGLGAVTGTIDVAKKEVRISAPVSIFAAQAKIKDGTKIMDLNLLAQRYVGDRAVVGATPSADDATGGKTYTAGAPSCVAVGK